MLGSLFLKGSLIGFSLAMPVGPIGVLCIQHSLRRGIMAGVAAGLGAALADAIYAAVAIFGVSLIAHLVTHYEMQLQLSGALLLWCLGIKIFRSPPPLQVQQSSSLSFSLSAIFLSTFALTLTNPLTMVCFAGLYASLGITPPEEMLPAILLTIGVLLGSALWWIVLSMGVTIVGKRFSLATSPLVNRLAGILIASFALIVSLSVIKQWLFIK